MARKKVAFLGFFSENFATAAPCGSEAGQRGGEQAEGGGLGRAGGDKAAPGIGVMTAVVSRMKPAVAVPAATMKKPPFKAPDSVVLVLVVLK